MLFTHRRASLVEQLVRDNGNYITDDDLEKAIDSGIDVLEMLVSICFHKSDKVRYGWKDEALAEAWHKAGMEMLKVRFPV